MEIPDIMEMEGITQVRIDRWGMSVYIYRPTPKLMKIICSNNDARMVIALVYPQNQVKLIL